MPDINNQQIYDFLKSHPVGVLATVDPQGNPHAAVIYFSVHEDFSVTFTTKLDTKKHANLKHNNRAMLVAYEASTQTTVQVDGTTTDISDDLVAEGAIRDTVNTAVQTSKSNIAPIVKLDAGYFAMYKLTPVQVRMAIFSLSGPGGYKDTFKTIDF